MSVFGEASIQVRTHIWIWWAEIALAPEAVALEQRATAVTLGAREEQFGVALTRESKASMIAIAACAHALDGVYGAVKEHVHVQAASRWATVLETLKAGFVVRGSAGAGVWARKFEWLFDLRDAAVHHKEAFAPPVRHPA